MSMDTRHGGWLGALMVSVVGLAGTGCSGPRCQGNPGDCADNQTCVDGTCTDDHGTGSSGGGGSTSSSGTPSSSSSLGGTSSGSAGSTSGTSTGSSAVGSGASSSLAPSGGSSSEPSGSSAVSGPTGSSASSTGTVSSGPQGSGASSGSGASVGSSGSGASGGGSSSGPNAQCGVSGAAFAVTPNSFIRATNSALAESGGRGRVTVCLGQAPTEEVLVLFTIRGGNPRLTMDPAVLVFTTENWAQPRTADVVAVDDLDVAPNPGPFFVDVALSTSDTALSAAPARTVTVEVLNDDLRQVRLTPVGGTVLPEGGSIEVAVRLDAAPAATKTVVVGVAPGNVSPAAGLVALPAQLTFTDTNFDDVQVVTLSAARDELVEQDLDTVLRATILAESTDSQWVTGTTTDLNAVSVTDDDEPGLVLTNATALNLLDRPADAVQFEVALVKQPQTDVVITASIPTQGALGQLTNTMLTFTNANWSVPQAVRVTGVSDVDSNPNPPFDVRVAVTGGDTLFAGVEQLVSVQSVESDVDNLLIGLSAGGSTMNEGDTRTLSISTTALPSSAVTVTVTSSHPEVLRLQAPGDATSLGSTSVMLTLAEQTLDVTVVAVADDVVRGLVQPVVTFEVETLDPEYDALMPMPIAFAVSDADVPNVVVTLPQTPLNVPEVGPAATFQVRLAKEPTSDVTLALQPSATALTQATLPAAPLVFTTANWNTNQAVQVTPINDRLDDPNRSFTVVLAPHASNQNVPYAALAPVTINMRSTQDDDTAGIVVDRTSGLLVEETGTRTETVLLKLATQPDGNDVLCDVTTTPSGAVTTNPSRVTFDATNWDMDTAVTVTGVADTNPVGGSRAFTLGFKCNYSSTQTYAPTATTTGVREGDYAAFLSVGSSDGSFVVDGTLDALCGAGFGGTPKVVLAHPTARVPDTAGWPLKKNAVYRSKIGNTWFTTFTVNNDGEITPVGRLASVGTFWTGFTAVRGGAPTPTTNNCSSWRNNTLSFNGTTGFSGEDPLLGNTTNISFGTSVVQCRLTAQFLCVTTAAGSP